MQLDSEIVKCSYIVSPGKSAKANSGICRHGRRGAAYFGSSTHAQEGRQGRELQLLSSKDFLGGSRETPGHNLLNRTKR